jgi:DNA polymerase III delta prime subunit
MENPLFLQKYQPLYFREFEADNELINVLQTLISMDTLNLLFVADIGSGKTTMLNAVIREYYQTENYQQNILYINSLKEQGINYYRNDVKTFCQTRSCIRNKKKIVVLDDLDTINEQSQQVFRNCIDKYSNNVHFLCSCSNTQKVIESLQSRLMILKINPLQTEQLQRIMNQVIEKEEIKINEEAKLFLLQVCNNNSKILLNYLEKIMLLNRTIDVEIAKKVCTNISFAKFEEYTTFVLEKDLQTAIKLLYSIYDQGYSVMDILDNYFLFVKSTNLLTEKQKYEVIQFICKYISVFHIIHEDEIELALFTNNLVEKI